jgi:hypothetical protein
MKNILSIYKKKGGQVRVIDLENTIGAEKTCKDGQLISDGAKSFGSFVKSHPELSLEHFEISHSTKDLCETGFSKTISVVKFVFFDLNSQ